MQKHAYPVSLCTLHPSTTTTSRPLIHPSIRQKPTPTIINTKLQLPTPSHTTNILPTNPISIPICRAHPTAAPTIHPAPHLQQIAQPISIPAPERTCRVSDALRAARVRGVLIADCCYERDARRVVQDIADHVACRVAKPEGGWEDWAESVDACCAGEVCCCWEEEGEGCGDGDECC